MYTHSVSSRLQHPSSPLPQRKDLVKKVHNEAKMHLISNVMIGTPFDSWKSNNIKTRPHLQVPCLVLRNFPLRCFSFYETIVTFPEAGCVKPCGDKKPIICKTEPKPKTQIKYMEGTKK